MTTCVLLSLQNGMLRSQTYCPTLPSCPVAPNLRIMDSSMSFCNLSFSSNFLTQAPASNGALMSSWAAHSSDRLVAKSCPTLVTPWTVACEAPLSWDSPGKNTDWSGFPFPSPGVLPDLGIDPRSPGWRIPWTEEPGELQSVDLQRVRQDWATNTFTFRIPWWLSL